MRACYNYVSSSAFRYVRKYSFQNIPAWHLNYAMFFPGNCYNFAAGLDFIAKELGMTARASSGDYLRQRGMTSLGWK
ncbi:MAG: hypothetical protein ACLSEX_08730 [Blautia sp.]